MDSVVEIEIDLEFSNIVSLSGTFERHTPNLSEDIF